MTPRNRNSSATPTIAMQARKLRIRPAGSSGVSGRSKISALYML